MTKARRPRPIGSRSQFYKECQAFVVLVASDNTRGLMSTINQFHTFQQAALNIIRDAVERDDLPQSVADAFLERRRINEEAKDGTSR